MGIHRHTEWRKRQVILEPELVEKLSHWHGGQTSYLYALSSTGARDLVSLSMIDMAMTELMPIDVHLARAPRGLEAVAAELMTVRQYWREHSAKEAGLESDPDFRYEYDKRDYGLSAADEAEYPTRSA